MSTDLDFSDLDPSEVQKIKEADIFTRWLFDTWPESQDDTPQPGDMVPSVVEGEGEIEDRAAEDAPDMEESEQEREHKEDYDAWQ